MRNSYFPNVEKLFVAADASIEQVMQVIENMATGIALVVDKENKLIATLTDGDIRRAILGHVSLAHSISGMLAQKQTEGSRPVTATIAHSRGALLALMNDRRIQQLPIIDSSERVVDLVLLKDLQKHTELPIQALIMAGGFGTRLRPLTETVPKPMLPVDGRPLLELTIERLTASGIRNVNVSTHYLPQKISEHFGDGTRFGVSMRYFQEDKPLGTGGALALLGEITHTTLVLNGDIVTDLDFRAMAEFHREHDAAITMAVANYDVRIPYGVVQHDGVFVTEVSEKPVISQFINAGIYLVEPRAQKHIRRDCIFNMTDLVESLVSRGERVVVFPVSEYWIDVGQPADYERVQHDVGAGRLKKAKSPTG